MSIRLVNPIFSGSVGSLDADAKRYIANVEAADGQRLESAVKVAISQFVVGCKTDGIWPAIKAACILAGARTLSGALVPLAGPFPTNIGFVVSDYSRKNGLTGNGTTKYLNTNRAGNADPQDSFSLGVNLSAVHSVPTIAGAYAGNGGVGTGASGLVRSFSASLSSHITRNRAATASPSLGPSTPLPGFFGASRSSSSEYVARTGGINYTQAVASQARPSENFFVFCRNNGSGSPEFYANATINYYWFGESLDLALLDARVSTLIAAIGAAIP